MKKGITAGCFDLLHAGHCMMLEEARSHCDHLTVLLQTDPSIDRPDTKESPTQSLPEREIQVRAIRWVDDVKIYQTERELIELLTRRLGYDFVQISVSYFGNVGRFHPRQGSFSHGFTIKIIKTFC